MADLKALADAVISGDQSTAIEVVTQAIADGMPAKDILDQGLIGAMAIVGDRFSKNEIYIPEMLIAARAMKSAVEILEPELVKAGVEPIGKFVVGTVAGDLHDIGKNLVAMMMKGAGFDVIDAGIDVSPETFVAKVKESGADVVGLSALLTTTMPAMEATVKALKDAGITAKVIIGGAPVTQAYADKIGADGYSADAASAVDVA
ncbi:MAG: corrinoid protein, partial [Planctomycetes bacterium]|nr:corrinoid protein [Planctomycetota bacterium]